MLGWVLARVDFLSPRALQDFNRLTYWVGLPCLLFHRIAGASPEIGAVGGLFAVGAVATFAAIVLGLAAAWALRLPSAARGTFAQAVFRGNLAFIGLPIVLYAFAGAGAAGAEASTLLVFGPMVVLYNILAVLVLLFSGGTRRGGALGNALYGLATNPILIACVLGLVFSSAGIRLPDMVQRTFGAIGQMALPLALICIGGTLYAARLKGAVGPAVIGSLMKVGLVPAIGYVLAQWWALSPEHTRIALLLLACPTASASYVLVCQLNGDEALASSMIVISNLLAVPAMIVVLAVT